MPNIIFAGTPEFAAYHLEQLIQNGLVPSLVLTQPDRKAGRGRKLQASSVKVLAENNNIDIYQPEKIDSDTKEFLQNQIRPDLLIVVAYGLILPKWLLKWPKFGSINVHASLLPRWRGAAPIQRAILAGDSESGVCIMQMDEGLDTGAVWTRVSTPITHETNAQMLHDQLQLIGAHALIKTIPTILEQQQKPTPQSEAGITYAQKLKKPEAQINWQESSDDIARKIRGFNPVPIAFSQTNRQVIFKIFSATPVADDNSSKEAGQIIKTTTDQIIVQCGKDAIAITELQETGKKRMLVRDYLNGKSIDDLVFIF